MSSKLSRASLSGKAYITQHSPAARDLTGTYPRHNGVYTVVNKDGRRWWHADRRFTQLAGFLDNHQVTRVGSKSDHDWPLTQKSAELFP